ncbi:MAG: radical SAM protein with 4Fe4S-binding SPASM domain [Crocinitomix sp.]|jgi:radical SAM protein with 4Fe4S-binding SPASM domain
MQKTEHLTLASNHFIYKGFSRYAVFKTKQGHHWFLPNEWGKILMNPAGFLANELVHKLPSSTQEEIQNDLMFLKRNGIIDFVQNCIQDKPPVQKNVLDYFIDTCSVSIGKTINNQLISALKTARIKTLELHFLNKANIEKCIQAFSQLNFDSLKIFLNYDHTKRLNLNETIRKTAKLTAIRIINTPFTYSEICKQIEIKKLKDYSNHEFNVRMLEDEEHENAHFYYNNRVHIDTSGAIKNSLHTATSFGNILTNNISEVVQSEAFQEIWWANKKNVDVCSDCELRAICLDRRPLIKRKNGTWYSNDVCNYNPYLGAFKGESCYKPLQDCGIQSNKQGFKILVDQFIAIKMNYATTSILLDTNLNLFY